MLTHREVSMNPKYSHRHVPLLDPQRRRCPVCQHPVYSLAGIHPQCAVRQADPPRPKDKARIAPRQNDLATKDGADAIVKEPARNISSPGTIGT
jgi:hypothetical protein